MNDIVVVLPGILGSVLQKDGKDIWALSPSAIARGLWTASGSIKDLELRNESETEEDLFDGVTAPRLLPDLHLVPGLWKVDGYGRLRKSLQRTFELKPEQNYFEFPYDWRRDNRAAARRLRRLSKDWLKNIRKQSPNAKLILIAHSMGGLVSRYFLECLGGWQDTRALITFGTPYRGCLKALDFISNGLRWKKGPIALLDLTKLLRSLTSVYQLLATYPCYDNGSGKLQRLRDMQDLPGVDTSRAANAFKFHDEIKAGVEVHKAEPGYLIRPIVGTTQPTLQSARWTGTQVEVLMSYEGRDESGDGTVPRVSATPWELSTADKEIFAACAHASLQNDDAVWANIEGIITGQAINLRAYEGEDTFTAPMTLSLAVEDAYSSDEPIVVRARPEKPVDTLMAQVVNAGTKAAHQATFADAGDGWMAATLPELLAPGAYRVTAYSGDRVRPVTDAFLVT